MNPFTFRAAECKSVSCGCGRFALEIKCQGGDIQYLINEAEHQEIRIQPLVGRVNGTNHQALDSWNTDVVGSIARLDRKRRCDNLPVRRDA